MKGLLNRTVRKINQNTKVVNSVKKLILELSNNHNKYRHLQVFLHREESRDYVSNREFLLVSPNCFGKVELLDLNVEDDHIIIEFMDCALQKIGKVRISINDTKSTVLFICWQDVVNIVNGGEQLKS